MPAAVARPAQNEESGSQASKPCAADDPAATKTAGSTSTTWTAQVCVAVSTVRTTGPRSGVTATLTGDCGQVVTEGDEAVLESVVGSAAPMDELGRVGVTATVDVLPTVPVAPLTRGPALVDTDVAPETARSGDGDCPLATSTTTTTRATAAPPTPAHQAIRPDRWAPLRCFPLCCG